MFSAMLFVGLLLQAGAARPTPIQSVTEREARIRQLVADIARSGRVSETGSSKDRLADPRQQIAPGAPPLLSFRYFDGAERHRFGKLDVIMDDAGH